MFKLRHLEAMRAVVAGRTITRAAEIIGITQPAMSRVISQLEQEIGLKLFARKGQQLALTGDGETFFQAAQQVFDAVENLSEIAEKIRAGNFGLLRVTAQSAFEVGLLPAALEKFSTSHPSVSIVLQFKPRREMENWLASGQFDLGLARMPIDDPDVHFEKFASFDVCVIAPSTHRFAAMPFITPADFDGCTFVSIARGTLLRYRIDEMMSNAGVRIRNIEAQTTGAAFQLVASGAGVSILHGLASISPNDSIVVRPLRPALRFDYALVWPTSNAPTSPAQSLAHILKQLTNGPDEADAEG